MNLSMASLPFGFLLVLIEEQPVEEGECLFCQVPPFQVAVFCLCMTSTTGPSSCQATLPYTHPGGDAPPILGGNNSVLLLAQVLLYPLNLAFANHLLLNSYQLFDWTSLILDHIESFVIQ